jgi:hypothetical protein
MRSKVVLSLTVAQYRLLGRILHGRMLPVSRYHTGTVCALERKGCVMRATVGVDPSMDAARAGLAGHIEAREVWLPLNQGRRVYASRGVLRAPVC